MTPRIYLFSATVLVLLLMFPALSRASLLAITQAVVNCNYPANVTTTTGGVGQVTSSVNQTCSDAGVSGSGFASADFVSGVLKASGSASGYGASGGGVSYLSDTVWFSGPGSTGSGTFSLAYSGSITGGNGGANLGLIVNGMNIYGSCYGGPTCNGALVLPYSFVTGVPFEIWWMLSASAWSQGNPASADFTHSAALTFTPAPGYTLNDANGIVEFGKSGTVPEPATLLLLASGLAGLGVRFRRALR